MPVDKLSEHFTLYEFTASSTAKAKGIKNTPTELNIKIMKHTALYGLEPLRTLLNAKYKRYNNKQVKEVSIRITSGFRCPALNKAVGGSSKSAHLQGYAVDIEATLKFVDGTKYNLPYTVLYEDIKNWVKMGSLSADQVIQEKSGSACWVHYSHHPSGRTCDRRQFLKYNNGQYVLDVTFK